MWDRSDAAAAVLVLIGLVILTMILGDPTTWGMQP